jgi:hypothetical protein
MISVDPLHEGAAAGFPDFIITAPDQDSDEAAQLVSVAPGGTSLRVGPRDVFIATFWPMALFVADVRRWQASTLGEAPPRFAYLVQDYEPGFYPRSPAVNPRRCDL